MQTGTLHRPSGLPNQTEYIPRCRRPFSSSFRYLFPTILQNPIPFAQVRDVLLPFPPKSEPPPRQASNTSRGFGSLPRSVFYTSRLLVLQAYGALPFSRSPSEAFNPHWPSQLFTPNIDRRSPPPVQSRAHDCMIQPIEFVHLDNNRRRYVRNGRRDLHIGLRSLHRQICRKEPKPSYGIYNKCKYLPLSSET